MDVSAIRKLWHAMPPGLSRCPCDPKLPLDPVALEDVTARVGAALNLHAFGFAEEASGRWTRSIDADITHVLFIRAEKGNLYGLTWGVDLTFMPGGPSLFETVYDYVLTSEHEFARGRTYLISGDHGSACVAHDAARVWRLLRPVIFAWWESAMTLDTIAGRAQRQTRRNWIGPGHDPDPAEVERRIRERAPR